MNRILIGVGGLALLTVVVLSGASMWAASTRDALLTEVHTSHTVSFPIPVPLTDDELAVLRAERAGDPVDAAADPLDGLDLDAIAMERAVARGKHLVESLYACTECHGADFAGGIMVDDRMLGTLRGPNLTSGGVTADFTATDWDRAVRHGLLPDGRASVMPAADYQSMSDHELSDVVAYIRSVPSRDEVVPRSRWGPLGTMLLATSQLPLAYDQIADHDKAHAFAPPPAGPTAEYGRHLVGVCTGCHGPALVGGPIPSGDPSWLPAANLTPGADGLAGWTYDDFVAALRSLQRPDGSAIREPMALVQPYAQNMTDTELQALWAYLQSVPAAPTPE